MLVEIFTTTLGVVLAVGVIIVIEKAKDWYQSWKRKRKNNGKY